MNKKQELGKKGEDLAAHFLELEGMKVIERNWRKSRYEIDIIALENEVPVFVEVKTKRSDVFIKPEYSVNLKKQNRIIEAANRYMETLEYQDEIRFDIVTVIIHGDSGHTITHMKDAFFPGMEADEG